MVMTSHCTCTEFHNTCAMLDNNNVDSDETQVEDQDQDLTCVPEDDHSLVIPESLEQEG